MKKIRKLIIVLVLAVSVSLAIIGSTKNVSAKGTVTDLYSVTFDHTSGSSTAWNTAKSNNSSFNYSGSTDYFYKLWGSSWSLYLTTPSSNKMNMKFSFSSCTPYTSGTTSVISGRSVLNSTSNSTYVKYTYSFDTTYYKTKGWRFGVSTVAYATPTYYTNTSGSYTFTPTDTIYIHIPIVTKTYNSSTKVYTYSHCVAVYKVVFKYTGYILGQSYNSRAGLLKMGNSTVADDGCGLVAAYNVAKMNSHNPNFYTLLKYANSLAEACTYSSGISNYSVQLIMKKAGCTYTKYAQAYKADFLSALTSGKRFVIDFKWDGGGHYISGYVTGGGKYIIYNQSNGNSSVTTLTSISSLWTSKTNGYFHTGWIVS